MKKSIFYICLPLLFLAGCYPTTQVTASWKNEKEVKVYRNVFVAALTKNTIMKSTVETDMAAVLEKSGLTIIKSLNEFPPNFANDSVPKEEMMNLVQKKGSEGILTVSIQRKETDSRYTRGAYSPMATYGYYGNFWGYYNHWYPYGYNDSYYTRDEVYYLETNLYDSKTENLVWSAQSKTYSYDGLTTFSKEFATQIAAQLKKDGLIP